MLCPYCGLNPAPLNYHEGVDDCQVAMRRFTRAVHGLVEKSPFVWNDSLAVRVALDLDFSPPPLSEQDSRLASIKMCEVRDGKRRREGPRRRRSGTPLFRRSAFP